MTKLAAEEEPGSLLQVKVFIVDSEPAIWRLLEIDPSLTLDRVHEILQTAVGWRDSHLHAFTDTDPYIRLRAVNGHVREPRRWVSQDLLEDNGNDLPETDWTLGQILTVESGPVFYEYDFGDGWVHRLELTGTVPMPASAPRARLMDGARRAPLEDSGGIGGYHDLLDVLADPDHEEHENLRAWVAWTAGPWHEFDPEQLDIDAVNNELAMVFAAPSSNVRGSGSESLVHELANRMPLGLRREFRSYVHAAGLDGPGTVEADVVEAMTAPFLWLTRRIGLEGLSLTAAGWLPPTVVREAMTELGWAKDWIGKANREDQTLPVLQLRESAQRLGLIRKIKGKLVLSSAAKRLLDDPAGLWLFLARSIAHRHRHDSERDAALLLLLEVAAGKRTEWADYLEAVAFGLGALGWRSRTGADLAPNTVHALLVDAYEVMLNLGIFNDRFELETNTVKAPGQAFARTALHS
ncbi:plasmid pRiA4b ORF-3 family protein (plasmid) [Pseudarthrobacter chlorophenolicus A6]|uniref:Plasmid pRiA4b ORF-3 family protein n=1 Tax=Pseudarthrobacter chlorophenolicus (strain ATCC 700700 / DSM 12829 / CIP 107037 / JCM 12360 / KCTC 9906 / NCIMB 13794 / A6) TaxID=452863 RepID=B8HJH8_PSECP|nr:plasmid pRiA4b ORF-3 family protein [Pseudarthrobacter chlorophenolicus]ACL42576.1 plasmid pRiA4b ORF-3 family protein [Pseudarthrobacter chlorophenolicus A6]SDQ09197.1 pRiA4b ORF-3-like protein [Pseudarthrobacter chlorophenolicus]